MHIHLISDLILAAYNTPTVEAALQTILAELCSAIGWQVGHIFMRSPDGSQMLPGNIWYLENPEQFNDFRDQSMQMHFEPGTGLIGQVFETGQALWITDIMLDPMFMRRGNPHLKAAFAFPIKIEQDILAILECFSTAATPQDTALFEILPQLSDTLSRLMSYKQAQNTLETKKLLEAVFANLEELVLVITYPSREIILCNPAVRLMLGYEPEELIGHNNRFLFANEHDYESIGKHSVQALEKNTFLRQELPMRHKDGHTVLTEINSTSAGSYERQGIIIAIVRDITARKQVEAEEREQRLLAEALHDTLATLTGTLQLDQILTRILKTVGRLVPHDAANIQLIQHNKIRVVYHQGYTDAQIEMMNTHIDIAQYDTVRNMITQEKPYLIPDVNTRPDWKIIPDLDWIQSYLGVPLRQKGTVIGFLNLDSTIPNFFTRKHAEWLALFADQVAIALENAQIYRQLNDYATEIFKLYEATEALEVGANLDHLSQQIVQAVVNIGHADCGLLLLDQARHGLLRLARTGSYQVQTPQPLYLDGLGLVPAAIREGRIIYAPDVLADERYLPNDSRTRSELVIPLYTKKGIIGVLDLQNPQTHAFAAHDQRILQTFADRAATMIENTLLDEEIRRYTEELESRVAERTAALQAALRQEKELSLLKSRFVTMTSHEFRTPLTVILTSSEMIRNYRDRMDDETLKRKLDAIHNSVTHMAELLDNVLAVGRFEADATEFQPELTDGVELCQRVISEQTPSPAQVIETEFDPSCQEVMVDRALFRQLFSSLLANAIKYSPSQSLIKIVLRCTGGELILQVQDQGIGIPEPDQARIFEAFHRGTNIGTISGTGLGLAIARRAVDLHGGSIEVTSQENQGATFTTRLPLAQQKPQE